jgi:hypothetical protein
LQNLRSCGEPRFGAGAKVVGVATSVPALGQAVSPASGGWCLEASVDHIRVGRRLFRLSLAEVCEVLDYALGLGRANERF